MSALRQAAWYALATLAGRGIGFLMLPVVTGHLAPADYGTLELLAALADAGGILLGFGLADTLFRFITGDFQFQISGHVTALPKR